MLLIAIGLAMDAFAVSICKGLAMRHPTAGQVVIVGLWFGGFQMIMPIIGYALGSSFHSLIKDVDHWIAFGLLVAIGLNMIRESFSIDEETDASLGIWTMFLLAVATSIDALAVGISLAMDSDGIAVPSVMIGVVTFAICAAGVLMGSKIGDRYNSRARFAGGIILILIGAKILLEHLGYL